MGGGRNPRAEAQALVGDGYHARVLEPSPPTVDEGPWFADDPVTADAPRPGVAVVAPVPGGHLTWDDWLVSHPDHREWAAERWLGAYRRLGPAPASFSATRRSLHRLVTHVLTPARYRANGKIALRWTRHGFGTPFFGDDTQVRVEGTHLVVQRGDEAEPRPLSTLADASQHVLGGPVDLAWAADLHLHDPPEPADPDEELVVDPAAAGFLSDWFGMAWSVLEELRADAATVDAGRVQLWPEHFDAAVDAGSGDRRASYGWSPGFAEGEEPYVYVSLWHADVVPDDPVWNATSYAGARLGLSDLAGEPDQRAAALSWLRRCRDRLASG